MLRDYNFVAVEGLIGSGKTSLATMLAEKYNSQLILEQFEDNPLLPKFYNEPERYAFQLELTFLAERFQQIKDKLMHLNLFVSSAVSDYFISKCLVFSQVNLKADEYLLYSKLFHIIYPSLPKPNLFVYLYVDEKKAMENILKRARPYEMNISPDYLSAVQKGYMDFIRQQQDTMRIALIDTGNIDFVNNKNDYDKMLRVLQQEMPVGINRFLLK